MLLITVKRSSDGDTQILCILFLNVLFSLIWLSLRLWSALWVGCGCVSLTALRALLLCLLLCVLVGKGSWLFFLLVGSPLKYKISLSIYSFLFHIYIANPALFWFAFLWYIFDNSHITPFSTSLIWVSFKQKARFLPYPVECLTVNNPLSCGGLPGLVCNLISCFLFSVVLIFAIFYYFPL